MRKLLRSIFCPERRNSGGDLPDSIVNAAIDRTVDRTDKRLRALTGYRTRLREPVTLAVRHVIRTVGRLPSAIDLSPTNYGRDPTLRAIFASTNHLRDTLGRLQTVRRYLDTAPGLPPTEIFGLMTMSKHRHSLLGLELHGDTVVRDVLQTAVSFSNHRFIAPATREAQTRRELKIHAFDFLLETAVQRIGTERARLAGLVLQRERLRREIETLNSKSSNPHGSSKPRADIRESMRLLRAELQRIDIGLGRHPGAQLGLEESLELVIGTLINAPDLLALTPVSDRLDYRGIKLSGRKAATAPPLRAFEFTSSTGLNRTVFLARIPHDALPPPIDVVKRGESVLGGNYGPIARSMPSR
jgi:hypothetical protein